MAGARRRPYREETLFERFLLLMVPVGLFASVMMQLFLAPFTVLFVLAARHTMTPRS